MVNINLGLGVFVNEVGNFVDEVRVFYELVMFVVIGNEQIGVVLCFKNGVGFINRNDNICFIMNDQYFFYIF